MAHTGPTGARIPLGRKLGCNPVREMHQPVRAIPIVHKKCCLDLRRLHPSGESVQMWVSAVLDSSPRESLIRPDVRWLSLLLQRSFEPLEMAGRASFDPHSQSIPSRSVSPSETNHKSQTSEESDRHIGDTGTRTSARRKPGEHTTKKKKNAVHSQTLRTFLPLRAISCSEK